MLNDPALEKAAKVAALKASTERKQQAEEAMKQVGLGGGEYQACMGIVL